MILCFLLDWHYQVSNTHCNYNCEYFSSVISLAANYCSRWASHICK